MGAVRGLASQHGRNLGFSGHGKVACFCFHEKHSWMHWSRRHRAHRDGVLILQTQKTATAQKGLWRGTAALLSEDMVAFFGRNFLPFIPISPSFISPFFGSEFSFSSYLQRKGGEWCSSTSLPGSHQGLVNLGEAISHSMVSRQAQQREFEGSI